MSNRQGSKACWLLTGLVLASPVFGYEVGTHAWMVNEAYLRSDLALTGTGTLRERLGFDRLKKDSVFDSLLVSGGAEGSCPDITSGSDPLHCYYDNIPTDTAYFFRRDPYSPFEEGILTAIAKTGKLRDADGGLVAGSATLEPDPGDVKKVAFGLGGWLMRGAIREDDLALQLASGHDSDPRGNIFRVFNHFWDPVHNLGMDAVAGCPPLVPGQVCTTALKWATGLQDPLGPGQDEDTSRRQHFSYRDATNNYWWALTRQRSKEAGGSGTKADDSRERMFRFATTLRSLGGVVHLLQDMSQPQHSRLDPHSPLQPPARQLYEAYTEARVLRLREDAIGLLSPLRTIDNGIPQPEQVPAPTAGCYPKMAFSLARKFFSNQSIGDSITTRMGLADYANRGFFTEGTLPNNTAGSPVYDYPPRQIFDAGGNLTNGYSKIKGTTHLHLILGGNAGVQEVSNYLLLHDVPDAVDHSGCQDNLPASYGGKAPLATQGLLYRFADLSAGAPPDEVSFSIGPENLTRMADLLIPRAVGYSAGMLNYFFRGRMVVEAPPAGLFALTDQGIPHIVGVDGYPVCSQTVVNPDGGPALCTQGRVFGFTTLQMKVRNDTPNITESGGGVSVPQKLTNGKLVAVARYHRDRCYRPDLSGAVSVDANAYWSGHPVTLYGPACPDQASWIDGRTSSQEISVSAEIPVDANGMITVQGQTLSIDGSNSVLVQFDFGDDPIPVSATDLFIQVVFRGNMGLEADGIAVGSLDVSEPTFMPLLNHVDYIYAYNQWMLAADARTQYPSMPTFYDPSNIAVAKMCIGDRLVMEKGDGSSGTVGIPSANIIRFAAILDKGVSHRTRTRATWWVDGALDYETYYIDSPNGAFVGRLAQAGKEKNPDLGPDVYTAGAMFQGRGRVFGDWYNYFYKDYQSTTWDWGTGLPTALLPPTSGGLFLPVRVDHLYLNNPQPGLCGTSSIAPASPQQSGGVSVGMDGHRE